MAFNPSNVVLQSQGIVRYNAGSDTLATVEGFSYFNPNLIRDRDVLCVTASDGRRLYTIWSNTLTFLADVDAWDWD